VRAVPAHVCAAAEMTGHREEAGKAALRKGSVLGAAIIGREHFSVRDLGTSTGTSDQKE
jgi:hypothetical protein